MDVILLFLELVALSTALMTSVIGLLRELVAFAETLMGHQKNDR